ncbi:MAG: homoserine kinase [Candidatus Tectomicrobia bacterium]|uniref:Homoserine kinase n=1 Tax=Tectimicrobiota bacterium TaxID=2528274 RepID=A0A932M015_UNCTE|nr:homoserine kinase [Candidatus Tectomicrobia bacterium]
MNRVVLTVPASTTNLGSGFDALGLALTLRNRFLLEETPSQGSIEVVGEGSEFIPRDGSNLVLQAAHRLYRSQGKTPPGLHIRQENHIPRCGGLGSSASAIIAGLVGANSLCGEPLSRDEILPMALDLEGHPDNVVPALYGGFTISALVDGQVAWLRASFPPDLRCVVALPDLTWSTAEARQVLPVQVPRSDAVFNVQRVSLLLGALFAGQHDLLRTGMADRLHQPYRAKHLSYLEEVCRQALEAGAWGTCLSGAGTSVLALASTCEEEIGKAMCRALSNHGIGSRFLVLEMDPCGAQLHVPSSSEGGLE